jgi:mRNA interferase RelE/StbE
MKIKYSKQSAKFIVLQDKATKQRIKNAIEGLTTTPPYGDIKQLQGYTLKTYRLRVGKFRIIYRYDMESSEQRVLFVSDIDSRGNIYK